MAEYLNGGIGGKVLAGLGGPVGIKQSASGRARTPGAPKPAQKPPVSHRPAPHPAPGPAPKPQGPKHPAAPKPGMHRDTYKPTIKPK